MRGKFFRLFAGLLLGVCLSLSMVFADTYTVYSSGTPSNTYVSWLADCMKNRPEDYVIWRDGDYAYKLAYGDLSYVAGSFSGSVDLVSISVGSGYQTAATMVFSSDSSFVLQNRSGYIVFSSLGGFPDIGGGVKSYEIQAILFAAALLFVYLLIDGILRAVRRFG